MSRQAEIERSFESDVETWHAVWVSPGQERVVFRELHDRGFAPYLPEARATIVRRGRKVDVVRPLFIGYVFVKLAIWRDSSWGKISPRDEKLNQGIEGVGGLLKDGALPSVIPTREINGLLYEDILAFLRGKDPRYMGFRSNHAKKKEIRHKAYIEKLRAA